VPGVEPKPEPVPLPPMKVKKQLQQCLCAQPAGRCINPCALVRCASPNCGADQKIVTKPGECCPSCASNTDCSTVKCASPNCGPNQKIVTKPGECCSSCAPTTTECLPVKCPIALSSRSNYREPLPVLNVKGVCPTACLCTEVVKVQIVPPTAKTIDEITNTVKMATGSADVTVVKNGNTFEVTIKGDADATENTTNTQKSFADATQSKLTATGSLGQVAVLPNDLVTEATGPVSGAGVVTLGSLVVALLVATIAL